jgi:hypothetical protein
MNDSAIASSSGIDDKKDLLFNMKDRLLLLAWIAGLSILGAFIWILCHPILSEYFLRQVNQSISVSNAGLRLTPDRSSVLLKYPPFGLWYSIENSQDSFFVFTVFNDGILGVFGARVNPENSITDIIPVSAHARQIFNRLSSGVIKVHARRIEDAAAHRRKNE